MKKLFLICLVVISCCGCLSEQNVKSTQFIDTNVGYFKHIEYDGHEYIIWRSGYAGGITHSPNCHCQNNK
jgi:hypothetical protein